MSQKIVNAGRLDIFRRVLADSQCAEVRFAALDLGGFLVAEIIGVQAALGFNHKVQSLFTIAHH